MTLRFLRGIVVGLVGAVVYWATSQLWPASIAVVLALLAMSLAGATSPGPRRVPPATPTPGSGLSTWYAVFVLLIEYDALTALSSARGPFAMPPSFTLGFIMIAGQAASHALAASVTGTDPGAPAGAGAGLLAALAVGIAPAVLLGIPGLVGLGSAVAMRLGLTSSLLRDVAHEARRRPAVVQQLTEAGFYLGTLASWRYV